MRTAAAIISAPRTTGASVRTRYIVCLPPAMRSRPARTALYRPRCFPYPPVECQERLPRRGMRSLERIPQRVHRRREVRKLLEVELAERVELRRAALGEP